MIIKKRPAATLDIECYRNFFLVMFVEVETRRRKYFRIDGETGMLTADAINRIRSILRHFTIVTFNGRNYDVPMLSYAMSGATAIQLKSASDRIILRNMRPWEFEDHYGVFAPGYIDHIDLIEVAPGIASLKAYGGRLHSRRLQDLPIHPDAVLTPAEREEIILYCGNDNDTTIDLFLNRAKQLKLREDMTREYGIDMRSKSDAQMAEAVIRSKIENMRGQKIERPTIKPGTTFHYKVPPFIEYKTPVMQEVLASVKSAAFRISAKDKVEMPKALENAKIRIGNGIYRMGIGGLHSSENCVSHYSDDEYVLIDRDVTSYYPAIILNCQLSPKHLGRDFLVVYRDIVARRLAAKASGDTVTADALKITINGSFGKFGNKWSVLYSPDLLIQTTVTGQLALLMLIETLEADAIEVVSANTDGVVIKCRRDRLDDLRYHIMEWELTTGFATEETRYRALFSRDVNNYIAIKENGDVKTKGVYADAGLQKNPSNAICVEAVIANLRDGVPIDETILNCTDIRKFVNVRSVKGGGVKDDEYLGKTVRWYYANSTSTPILYKSNGYKVPRTEGAKPLMVLPDELPEDINRLWYIYEANSILAHVGAL